jgi:hypothetical protein
LTRYPTHEHPLRDKHAGFHTKSVRGKGDKFVMSFKGHNKRAHFDFVMSAGPRNNLKN